MTYCFPTELQHLVEEELASGSYSSEDELLLEAVRLLHQRQYDLRQFKAQLQTRLDSLDDGDGVELESDVALRAFFDDVQARGLHRCEASRAAP
jgi:Arc/MetJ-type ribon-helix-helix transcriptional regulator